MNTEITTPKNIEEWVALICEREMPVFDMTARKVIAFTGDDLAPISALANVILCDASLTARVLKLANSIFYNPNGVVISTVTRAIVVLGFNVVRDICLAVRLIEELVKGAARDRLGRELAQAMHAAIQARALAEIYNEKTAEEVFIATLLSRIGEMAFWCYSGEIGSRLEQRLNQPNMSPERAQEQVLGFHLSQLSRQLIKEWRLSELLQRAIHQSGQGGEQMQAIKLGQQLAQCAKDQGWQSQEMTQLIQKIAKITELSVVETQTLVHQKARAAIQLAADLGASFAAAYIPLPGAEAVEVIPSAATKSGVANKLLSDGALQIKILRELDAVLEAGQFDFNVIMELVLEGIYRGIGMDRVIFALVSPDKKVIKAKYALSQLQEELVTGFQFSRDANTPDVLFQTLDRKVPRWFSAQEYDAHLRLIPAQLTQLMGQTPFMLAPIVVNQHSIGLFYADRSCSQRALDNASFSDFKHFVAQANVGISLAAARRKR
ncbi:histidine kinase [Chromatium okenii]|uniref:HDOD domain-containing protein n=1 Tax=Chromatium okenii TaxID=61644 RepID=UPI0019033289|nr:HDOD domain-containing protein [Chromatium okenii]MBK1640822.1 histidine kinase [Chromatium okenii]